MLRTPGFVRDMKSGEEGAVDALLRAAFETDAEARLVDRLRKTKVVAGESVMPMGDDIVGYFALSRMLQPKGWLALAPVAIHPDVQGQGYGRRMLGMLTEWARLTNSPVVVLGDPKFYEASGFSSKAAANLSSPYPVEFTLLCGVDGSPSTELRYPNAFDGG